MKQYDVRVRAIRVTRPYPNIKRAIHRVREIKKANGRSLAYFMIPADNKLDTTWLRAHEGDWIVQFPDGHRIVVDDDHFHEYYEKAADD